MNEEKQIKADIKILREKYGKIKGIKVFEAIIRLCDFAERTLTPKSEGSEQD